MSDAVNFIAATLIACLGLGAVTILLAVTAAFAVSLAEKVYDKMQGD